MNSTVERLYTDHHDWLYGWLKKKLNHAELAADMAQDTFVRILAKKEAVTPQEPRALLTTIAKGLVSNFYRHKKIEENYLAVLATLPENYMPDPETQAILLEAVVELDRRLDGLDVVVRQAFLMTQLEGMTQPQAAGQLGVSVATVQRYIVKALHQCCFADFDE